MSELKPCRFCGSAWAVVNRPANGSHLSVKCKQCNAHGPGHAGITEAQAIAAWNTRPQPSAEPVAWMYERLIQYSRTHGMLTDEDRAFFAQTASALEAARREALEQAASVVEGWRETDWPEGFCRFTAEEMSSDRAERIRALAHIKP